MARVYNSRSWVEVRTTITREKPRLSAGEGSRRGKRKPKLQHWQFSVRLANGRTVWHDHYGYDELDAYDDFVNSGGTVFERAVMIREIG